MNHLEVFIFSLERYVVFYQRRLTWWHWCNHYSICLYAVRKKNYLRWKTMFLLYSVHASQILLTLSVSTRHCLKPLHHALLHRLRDKRTICPRTIIYCRRLEDCANLYFYFKSKMGESFTEPCIWSPLTTFKVQASRHVHKFHRYYCQKPNHC